MVERGIKKKKEKKKGEKKKQEFSKGEKKFEIKFVQCSVIATALDPFSI